MTDKKPDWKEKGREKLLDRWFSSEFNGLAPLIIEAFKLAEEHFKNLLDQQWSMLDEKNEIIARLEAEIEQLVNDYNASEHELLALKAEKRALIEKVERFLYHRSGCSYDIRGRDTCDCGLFKLKEELKKEAR